MKYARVEVDGTTRWGTVRDGAVELLDGSPYDGGQPDGPGESYLTVTDALYDNAERIRLSSCRQEGVAAFMAEAGTAPVNSTGNSSLRND